MKIRDRVKINDLKDYFNGEKGTIVTNANELFGVTLDADGNDGKPIRYYSSGSLLPEESNHDTE